MASTVPFCVLLLAFCCRGYSQLQLGSFVPSIFGGPGMGFGNPGGGGGVGFNPLGVVQNILSNIPGGSGVLGAAGIFPPSNAVNPLPGVAPFGDFSSFWRQPPGIPGYPPFGGSFGPNAFGGGGQPGFGPGPGHGMPGIPGPQMPPLTGGFPSGMPSIPGMGTNQGPQQRPLGEGVPPGGPAFPGAGGSHGPHLPQPQPPLAQGPNVPPVVPGQGIPNVPASPGGTDHDIYNTVEQSCSPGSQENRVCLPVAHCRAMQRRPGLCTGDRGSRAGYICCAQQQEHVPTPPRRPDTGTALGEDQTSVLAENWQFCGKHPSGISHAVQFVQSGRSTQDFGKFPFAVAIFRDNFHILNFWCGGTLITGRVVLSTAHCFSGTLEDTDFIVHTGALDVSQDNETDSSQVKVRSIHVHPDYNEEQHYADLALLLLGTPINFPPTGQHLPCLPEPRSILDVSYGTVLSWGQGVFGGKVRTHLHDLQVPMISNDQCNRAYQALPTYQTEIPQGINAQFICIGNLTDGEDSCLEDAGGPLLQKVAVGNKALWELVGTVSFRMDCDTSAYPGVYTRVASFLPWILGTTYKMTHA